jgi:colicin import membrane protein
VQAREKSDREAEAEAERERQAAEAKLAEDDRMHQAALDKEEEEERQRREAQERDAEEERQRRAAEERRNKLQAEEQQRKADAEREQQEQLAEEARQREQEEQEETEQREREEAERKAAAAAEQQKRDEDAAAILEARAKVLARRKEKQRLDGGASILSNSLPSSLQTAAAGLTARSSAVADPVDEDSRGDSNASNSQQSYSYSATSLIRNNMQPGVSTSLDSAAGALRSQPSRNLFGNNPSFQSLQDVSITPHASRCVSGCR